MDEALRCGPQQRLIWDERHVLILGGNALTPSDPEVTIRDTEGAEDILYLVQ